jgi:hypothetical protein
MMALTTDARNRRRRANGWLRLSGLLVAMALVWAPAVARADDDKSGRAVSWVHTVDGKVTATETLRTVVSASGNFFASGEYKMKAGKKTHKRSHLQRTNDGRILRYQRMDGGPKAPGIRIFEWEGQMRLAQVNGPGKPIDLGALPSGRLWESDMLHLVALWGLPTECRSARLTYYDVAKQARGEANLSCTGRKRATDEKKQAREVNVFSVTGVPGEAVELWVDGSGELVGARVGARTMLRAKHSIEGVKDVAPAEDEGEDSEKQAIKDRGVGE